MSEENHMFDENMDSDTERGRTSSSSSSSSSSSESENEHEHVNEKLTLKAWKVKRSKGKWKVCSDKKVFKREWLEIYPWVDEDPKDPQLALCKICNTSIKATRGILDSHQKSKKHLKNLAGPEYVEEPKKDERADPKPAMFGIDQITDEQISFFAESQADAAHQAVTSVIDKLVEKYHEDRLTNLKVQNDALYELNAERAKIIRTVNQKKLERRLQHEAYMKEAQEAKLKFLLAEHETKLRAMEGERDAKLRAVEQELVFAKQEYEKKVRLLDSQLSSMK